MADIEYFLQFLCFGGELDFQQALDRAQTCEPTELYDGADRLRKKMHGNHFDLCPIINARSGLCSENCSYCSQSSRSQTEASTYDRLSYEEMQRQARRAQNGGVSRLSHVTSGREQRSRDRAEIAQADERLGQEGEFYFCASMGLLTREKAARLAASGVRRYHCNLETSRSFFPEVCSLHTYDEKVETIRIVSEAGMDICSGGVIGLGERFEQRLELAFELRELGVFSIPISILIPLGGTPFDDLEPLSLPEVLTSIAMFRFINPHAVVRLAGGRSPFGQDQYRSILCGANGAIVGDYLTATGNEMDADIEWIQASGFDTSIGEIDNCTGASVRSGQQGDGRVPNNSSHAFPSVLVLAGECTNSSPGPGRL